MGMTEGQQMTDKMQWWGYLHADGSVHVKRWFGDPKDYTTDCEGNAFVVTVVKPFAAIDRVAAYVEVARQVGVPVR
jgi:hypothetical protein